MPKRKKVDKSEDMIKVRWHNGTQSWVLVRHIRTVEKGANLIPDTIVKMGRHFGSILSE